MLLLAAYEGQPTNRESLRAYQATSWGSAEGQTAVLELLGTRNQRLADKAGASSDADRLDIMRARLVEYEPVFAVCYCKALRPHYEEVLGATFDADGACVAGRTLAILLPHPTSPSAGSDQFWVETGLGLREKVKSERATALTYRAKAGRAA